MIISLNHIRAETEIEGDYEYEDNGDGAATITKYIGGDFSVEIPNELNGLTVTITKINDGAFTDSQLIRSIDIPDSYTSIEDSAFSGILMLTKADIHNDSVIIASNVFPSNPRLTIIGHDPSSTAKVNHSDGNAYETTIK